MTSSTPSRWPSWTNLAQRLLRADRVEDGEAFLPLSMAVGRIGSFSRDMQTGQVRISAGLCEIFGLPPGTETMDRETWFAMLHPDDRARVIARLEAAVAAGEELVSDDFRIVRPDGALRFIEGRVRFERDESGRLVRAMGVHVDLTERRAAELALRDSEQRLRLALDASGAGTFDWDIRTGTVLWDDRVRALWGVPAGELVTAEMFYGGLEPEDRLALEPIIAAALDPAGDGVLSAEYRVTCRRDGVQRWVAARGQTIFVNGQAERLLGTITEITRQKRAEEELRRVTQELEARVHAEVAAREDAQRKLAQAERMQALGQLAGGIAHDFNNVLQSVQGAAALIERKPDDPAAARRLAHMVLDAAGRGAGITRRLLAFARRDELVSEPVEPRPLLEGMQEILSHTLGARVAVRVEARAGLPPLLADRGQLETVLVNLAANARDAMPGGGALVLGAVLDPDPGASGAHGLARGTYLRLFVRDEGAGMDAATLARVTEPFFTTKPRGQGTGLGLAMARGFAEQSGGALRIESAPGRGTTVSLWLPVAPTATAGEGAAAEGAAPDDDKGGERARVIVVDDDAAVREVVAELLEDTGYSVAAFEEGEAVIAHLRAGEPAHVLVADLTMPGMDGLEVIRTAQSIRPGLPAVLLTGYAGDAASIAVGGALSGAFSLLRKPITAAALADRVAALLAARAAVR